MLHLIRKTSQAYSDVEAEKAYHRMKNAVALIADTEGFKKMREFWDIEYMRLDQEIERADASQLELLVKVRSIVKKHILWIERLSE